jgi:hypothetical protein
VPFRLPLNPPMQPMPGSLNSRTSLPSLSLGGCRVFGVLGFRGARVFGFRVFGCGWPDWLVGFDKFGWVWILELWVWVRVYSLVGT